MFDGTTGQLLHTFLDPTPHAGDHLGATVAVMGEYILIGEFNPGAGAANVGAVHLFDGSTWELLRTFLHPEPTPGDNFGRSIAVVGTNVLVAAREDDTGAEDAGAAYLFDGSTGGLLQTFLNPTPEQDDIFANALTAAGNNVFIGATRDDTSAQDAGAVYRFDASPSDPRLTIPNPFPNPDDGFGVPIAAMGNNILVGAGGDDTDGEDVGAAYLFDGSTGALLQSFFHPDPTEFDTFGRSVATVGDNVLVGTGRDVGISENHPGQTGAAYLFNGSTGQLLQTFYDPNPEPSPEPGRVDWFGGLGNVAAFGDNVLIGASGDDTAADEAGAVYLFNSSDGSVIRIFVSPAPNAGDDFGYGVAAVGNNVLIGALGDDTAGTDAGAAYLFDGSTGNLLQTFLNPTPNAGDDFGKRVAFLGNDVLITSGRDDTDGLDSGAAYLFDSSTGELLQTFRNPTPEYRDAFGAWIQGADNKVLMGSHRDDIGATAAGVAYLFDASTGGLLKTYLNPTPGNDDLFGVWGAFLDNGDIAMGSYRDDAGGPDAGAVYVYEGIFSTSTDADGNYRFSGLESGAYQVRGIVESGYTQTAPAGTAAHTVAVATGEDVTGLDFGMRSIAASISGTVFEDLDADGVHDPGESGLEGWTAVLEEADIDTPLLEIPNPGSVPGDHEGWGFHMTSMGNNILIGASLADRNGVLDTGVAYLLDGTTGEVLQTFENPDPMEKDLFGVSLAPVGTDKVVIGTRRDTHFDGDGIRYTGVAYLFDIATGQPEVTVFDPNPRSGAEGGPHFGSGNRSIAAFGDGFVIGSDRQGATPETAGIIYHFDADGVLVSSFLDPSMDTPGNFGRYLSVMGNDILAPNTKDDTFGEDAGAVHLIDGTTGDLVRTFYDPDPGPGDHFGTSVFGDGDIILANALWDDTDGTDTGIAFAFHRDGQLLQTFHNPTPDTGDQFGQRIAIQGDKALIISHRDNVSADHAGAAYLFEVQTGTLLHTYLNPTPEVDDHFGNGASFLANGNVAISCARDDLGTVDSGAVYLYDSVTTTTTDSNGNYSFTGLEPGTYQVREILPEGYTQTAPPGDGTYTVAVVSGEDVTDLDFGNFPTSGVVGRYVFYNNSAFDGNDPLPNASDDNAIAPDKQALLPGETATFANYTSYSRGINGIMIDIAGLSGTPTAEHLYFRNGNTEDPGSWPRATFPGTITVRRGAGTNDSDRVTLIWPDNTIKKEWLQVTVLPGETTGLLERDVFYFGNAIGETGNSTTDAKVTAADMLGARDNQRNFLDPAPIDFPFDFDRDARVKAADMLLARNNQTHFMTALQLITVPGPKAAGGDSVNAKHEPAHDAVLRRAAEQETSPAKLAWLHEFEENRTRERLSNEDGPPTQAVEALLASF